MSFYVMSFYSMSLRRFFNPVFRLYYMHTNFTDVQTIRESGVQSEREHKVRIEYNLTGLGKAICTFSKDLLMNKYNIYVSNANIYHFLILHSFLFLILNINANN